MGTKQPKEQKQRSQKTPTFLLELPLVMNAGQAKRIRGHLEAGRQFYNAVLSEGQRRLRRMQADPAWQEARAIPRTHTQERHGFSEYAFHELARERRASSERAGGADARGFRYVVQLALEGVPQRKKHAVGNDIIGADLGPATIALVPRAGEASLAVFCEELAPDEQAIRRLQRRMDRQRRAANPGNYDEQGRIKKQGKNRLRWKTSKSYERTRRRKATRERKLAAHRKSLHGRHVHEIVAVGNTVILEKISYKAWQKQYGNNVGLRAPGRFVEMLRRTVARTGGTLLEVPTRTAKLSQVCHRCGCVVTKPLSQRWHHRPCGVVPVHQHLYSPFL